MLKIFRTNQLLLSVLLLAYAAFMRMSYFQVTLEPIALEPGIGNSWIYPYLKDPSIGWFLVAIFLIFIQGLIANKIFFNHRLHRNLSLFAGLFLVLIGSLLPSFLNYSSFLPANIFLLLALAELLKVYRASKAADILFNSGFFIGLATLFQPVYLIFLLPIGFSVINLKSGKFRDIFTVFAGAIVPLFLIGTFYFINDEWLVFWNQQWGGSFGLQEGFNWQNATIPALVIMVFLLLFAVFNYRKIIAKTKMEVQVKINTIYWFLGGSGLAILLSPSWDNYRWQAMIPVLGLLLGIYFTKAKPIVVEVSHLLLVILLFLLHQGVFERLFT